MAKPKPVNKKPNSNFHLEFKNQAQKMAWGAFDQHDVLFLLGQPGTGKTFLACAFAVSEILAKKRKRIILTRPIVEAGESLGYLPGGFDEKVNPYMLPMFDCLTKCVGLNGPQRDLINKSIEIAPIAYMRGRALRNEELIPTPDGMKKMGDLVVGDYVFGSNGSPTKVVGVYPQGKVPVYEIKFSDRTKSVCCGNHLWNTMTLDEKQNSQRYSTKKTFEIIASLKNSRNQKNHRVPVLSSPVQFTEKKAPIDPYFLGVLLGHSSKGLLIKTSDTEIIDECVKSMPENGKIIYNGKCEYQIESEQIKQNLMQLNLFDKSASNKFVPENYKFNIEQHRLSLLQGLLDSNGWIYNHYSGSNRIQYLTFSKKLAEDVMFLVRSLGGIATTRRREDCEDDFDEYNNKTIRHMNSSYLVDISINQCPFKLSRKAKQYKNNQEFTRLINSITPIGEDYCTCIQVEADDHLYLTNDFIVTHNTFDDAICIFDEAQNATKTQLKLFMTRFGENSKLIITGDPKQSDIKNGNTDLVAIVQKLEKVPGIGVLEFKSSSIVRHPMIAAIVEKFEEE